MRLQSPQLQAFMAVVESKTVHGAADVLNLTQTAVTQRIRTLERQMQVSLFMRTRRGMQPTPEGDALLRYCRAVSDLEQETIEKLKGAGLSSGVPLRITAPASILRTRIVPQCYKVMRAYNKLTIQFKASRFENLAELLRTGKSDFAIMEPQQVNKEMSHKLLKPEEYVLICSRAWKGRRLKSIVEDEHIIDFSEEDKLTLDYLKKYKLLDIARPDRHFVNGTALIIDMISSGMGYGVATKDFSEPFIKNKKLMILNQGRSLKYEVALVWFERPQMAEYFEAIIDAIQ